MNYKYYVLRFALNDDLAQIRLILLVISLF